MKRRTEPHEASIASFAHETPVGSIMLLPLDPFSFPTFSAEVAKVMPEPIAQTHCALALLFAAWDDPVYAFDVEGVDPDEILSLKGEDLRVAANAIREEALHTRTLRLGFHLRDLVGAANAIIAGEGLLMGKGGTLMLEASPN